MRFKVALNDGDDIGHDLSESRATMTIRAILITACTAKFFDMCRELMLSIKTHGSGGASLACMDLGLRADQVAWLQDRGIEVTRPTTGIRHGLDKETLARNMGYLARPYLRENFPGYDVYVWLDADTWVQDGGVVVELVDAATKAGGAFVHEREPLYKFRPDLVGWKTKNFLLGYGLIEGLRLALKSHLNSGVFALHAGSPIWEEWQAAYQRAYDRTARIVPHDQFALNYVVYRRSERHVFVSSRFNWICELSPPAFDPHCGVFCVPRAPYEPIRVMHLAGHSKSETFDLQAVGGGTSRGRLRFGAKRIDA